jgi:hypothetical protein
MPIPVFFACFIIFLIWFQYEIRKNKKLSSSNSDAFWKREADANLTRKKDISNLAYLIVPTDQLPMEDQQDPDLNYYRDTILKLSSKKILNLTGITNTELKLQYGISNFGDLMEYDNNYIILVSTLHKWGERFYSLNLISSAVTVLEYAVECLTDAGNTYKLLASIYKGQGELSKIDSLIELIPNTKVLRKESLIKDLLKIKTS